jgi:hypothetical protein
MSMHTVIVWVLRLIGCLLIYAAVFIYEDEEGIWQNRLEKWRDRIKRARTSSLSKLSVFMGGIAELTGKLFDHLFGKTLFSVRGVGVSVCYSIASFFFSLQLISLWKKMPPMSFEGWALVTFFAVLGTVPAIVGGEERETLWIWGLAIFASVVFPILKFADIVRVKFGLARTLGGLLFVIVLFGISFACDVLYIALTRWMMRKASQAVQFPKIIGIVLLNALLGITLALGPFALGFILLMSTVKLNGPQSLGVFSVGLMLGPILNFVDVVACSVFLLLMLFVLVHRLIWPVLERPLYACARYGVIKNKKLLWALGGTLILVPSHSVSIWEWLLKTVLHG